MAVKTLPSGAASAAAPVLAETAFAKINLTLRVVGKHADGYHELESLVCFADVADRVTLQPGAALDLRVRGPIAAHAGPRDDNLVLKAARALSARIDGLTLGRFDLVKHIPAQAGLGGGSADAAAALRLIARVNNLDPHDRHVRAAARATGADVPVCLDQQARWMRGIGEVLSPPVRLPRLQAVLVHPDVALATKDVFAALALPKAQPSNAQGDLQFADRASLFNFLVHGSNDLEIAAMKLAPAVSLALSALRAQAGCELARMSGSGSACFGIFASRAAARAAARIVSNAQRNWWVKATMLGATRNAPAAH